jgi:hypothetical protein
MSTPQNSPARSAYDIYTFYLEPADLGGRSHTVRIRAVQKEDIYDARLRRKVPKLVLYFVDRKKALVLNKTQVGAMIDVSGSDDWGKWLDKEIIITPAQANDRQTIAISIAAPKEQPA